MISEKRTGLFLSLLAMAAAASLSLAGCAGGTGGTGQPASSEAPPVQTVDKVTVRVGAMSGPTAMGLAGLMEENAAGKTENSYEFADPAAEASAMVTPLAQGELDIAAVPANLAAVLYNRTGGGVRALAVNTLGVLNLVERGDTLTGIGDLAGRRLFATGQSAVPEYVIRRLLTANGIDPDRDVEIRYCADTTEALSLLRENEGAAAILPQPFVTAALAQIDDLRVVQDLNDAWAEAVPGCSITTGVTVVRTAFAKEHPEAVAAFLREYAASAALTSEDPETAAALIAGYGIVAKAPLARKALPGCHIVCLTGPEMRTALEGFLEVLYEQKPESVGGALPGDDFYGAD